ncbi:GYF domain-containing protein [Fontisphaera persica]|uniref:GYF domain-containing protein n=1 Tax=Fontisphaera persica TaxID=2974023 RepID=UPI0024BF2953|nr:GYF domain-containing protein [Fontisphaera persica]WCJ59728.1 GYF domain-containing protein [Fontisphaera persica]
MYKIIGADGREYGPVSAEEIKQWIREGRAVTNTKAQAVGTVEWRDLRDFPEFAGCFGASPPPPPTATAAPPGGAMPPVGVVTVDPRQEAEAIIARGIHFSIGDCLSRGWQLVMSDFWPVVGVSALILVILAGTNAAYVGLLINGPLLGGLYYYFLKKIRGQSAALGDAFAGFSLAFLQLFLLNLISGIFISLGLVLCLIPGIYLAVAYYFIYPLLIDRRLEFWPTMEICRRVVTSIWWQALVFVLVMALVNLAGALALCVGIFISFPVTIAATCYAYESIFNGRQPTT